MKDEFFTTKTGKKKHLDGCHLLKKSKIPIAKELEWCHFCLKRTEKASTKARDASTKSGKAVVGRIEPCKICFKKTMVGPMSQKEFEARGFITTKSGKRFHHADCKVAKRKPPAKKVVSISSRTKSVGTPTAKPAMAAKNTKTKAPRAMKKAAGTWSRAKKSW